MNSELQQISSSTVQFLPKLRYSFPFDSIHFREFPRSAFELEDSCSTTTGAEARKDTNTHPII